jgi:ArsR family transcriptional regulator
MFQYIKLPLVIVIGETIKYEMTIKQFEQIGKALADQHRITILQEFKQDIEFLHCSRIPEVLELSQPSISHHVKILVQAEIIFQIKEGRHIKYMLNNQLLADYMAFIKDFMNKKTAPH